MKKLFILPILALGLAGCGNMDVFDTVLTYDVAITRWPDGTTKTIKIKKWCCYEGEQIQIIDFEGNAYLLNSVNTVLIQVKR
jgi:hypothetical protein